MFGDSKDVSSLGKSVGFVPASAFYFGVGSLAKGKVGILFRELKDSKYTTIPTSFKNPVFYNLPSFCPWYQRSDLSVSPPHIVDHLKTNMRH